jgi:hypothetical protein
MKSPIEKPVTRLNMNRKPAPVQAQNQRHPRPSEEPPGASKIT